ATAKDRRDRRGSAVFECFQGEVTERLAAGSACPERRTTLQDATQRLQKPPETHGKTSSRNKHKGRLGRTVPVLARGELASGSGAWAPGGFEAGEKGGATQILANRVALLIGVRVPPAITKTIVLDTRHPQAAGPPSPRDTPSTPSLPTPG